MLELKNILQPSSADQKQTLLHTVAALTRKRNKYLNTTGQSLFEVMSIGIENVFQCFWYIFLLALYQRLVAKFLFSKIFLKIWVKLLRNLFQ